MPRMIGVGRRNRVASSIARSCVLSPISASATTAVEVSRTSMKNSGAGRLAIPTDIIPAARPGRRCDAIGLAQAVLPLPPHHGLSTEYVDAAARRVRAAAGDSPDDRAAVDGELQCCKDLYQGAVILPDEDCQSRLLARRSGSGGVVNRCDAPKGSSGRDWQPGGAGTAGLAGAGGAERGCRSVAQRGGVSIRAEYRLTRQGTQ